MKMNADEVSIKRLLLDDENPRLPEDLKSKSQKHLLRWMANEYNTLEVAQSIAEYGYFDSEPMIAIAHGNNLKIVEGNRRLPSRR